jgi:hypothetical protein
MEALEEFGAPCDGLSRDDFQKEGIVFQIGVAPRRIDILTSVDGLEFEEALANSPLIEIDGIPVHVISISDLIKNKRATGRIKDLADAQALEELLSVRREQ